MMRPDTDLSEIATLPSPLEETVREAPGRIAVMDEDGALTFEELEGLVGRLARRLRQEELEPGSRVVLRMRRGRRLIGLLLACWRAGCVAAPLSTRLPEASARGRVEALRAGLLITDRAVDGVPAGVGVLDANRLFEMLGEEKPLPAAPWRLDAPATVVFTTGSTGRPKAALHSLRNHVCSAAGSNENLPLRPGDRWLLALPLYHVGGLGIVMRCLLAGATIVIPARGRPLGALLEDRAITHVSLVPTQLRRLLEEERALPALKAMLIGGAPLPAPLLEAAYQRGYPLFTTYGQTEMTSQVTTTPPGAGLEQLRSSGQVLRYRALKIAGSGEILVRGATLFQGYLQGERLDAAVDEEGWFHTRDVGRLDERGALRVTGRLDNQFISGGENIQPEAIERALCREESVLRAVVVPVEDAEYGQRPVAFVEMRAGRLDAAALRQALERELPRFMIPEAFHPWPAGQEGMKISRSRLAELAVG